MAQHFDTKYEKDSKMKKIAESVRNQFDKQKNYGFKTSSRWQEAPISHAETPNEKVVIIKRKVPASRVFGGHAWYEVHYDNKSKNINKLYMVA